MYHELTDRFVVSSSPEKTWAFFSSAENLPAITPPWLAFSIQTPKPIDIRLDTVLDYTIRWSGLPVRWRTKIIEWSPPYRFVDLQIRGPYAMWHHQHTFSAAADGVLCEDRVIYRVPFPVVGRLVHAALVRKQLLEIFRFRRKVIGDRLGWVRAAQADVEIGPL